MPNIQKNNIYIKHIASDNRVSGNTLAKKYSAKYSVTDTEEIFKDKEIGTIVIATEHDITHYEYLKKAIEFGKNVFVEKPLVIKKSSIIFFD